MQCVGVLVFAYFNKKMIEKVLKGISTKVRTIASGFPEVTQHRSFSLGQAASLKALEKRKEMGCWDCTGLLPTQV